MIKRIVILAVVLVLLIVGPVWAYHWYQNHRQARQLQDIQAKLADEHLTREQRREQFEQLTVEQRDELWRQGVKKRLQREPPNILRPTSP